MKRNVYGERTGVLALFLDWLLGAPCRVCGVRVFPRDLRAHHAGHGITWRHP